MYRSRETGELKTEPQIRREFAKTSFPRPFKSGTSEDKGYDPVLSTPKPETTMFQRVANDGTEQDANGNWVEKWAVVDKFSDIPATEDSEAVSKAEQEAALVLEYKAQRQQSIKAECQDVILSRYPTFKQVNAALGVYGAEYAAEIKAFIQCQVVEEDRIFAAIAAADLAAIDSVTASWPKQ